MIVGLATLLGGQRAQCVQHLAFTCLLVTTEEGPSIQMPNEKVRRQFGSALPIPTHFFKLLKWFISEVRPVLLARDESSQVKEWLDLRSTGQSVKRESELFNQITHHLWIK
jgi:hypothetical protein